MEMCKESATFVLVVVVVLLQLQIQEVKSSPWGIPNPIKVLEKGSKQVQDGVNKAASDVGHVFDKFGGHGRDGAVGSGLLGTDIHAGRGGIGGIEGLGNGGLRGGLNVGGLDAGLNIGGPMGTGGMHGGLNVGGPRGTGGLHGGLNVGGFDAGLNIGGPTGTGGVHGGLNVGGPKVTGLLGGLNVGVPMGTRGLHGGLNVGVFDAGLNVGSPDGLGGLNAGLNVGGNDGLGGLNAGLNVGGPDGLGGLNAGLNVGGPDALGGINTGLNVEGPDALGGLNAGIHLEGLEGSPTGTPDDGIGEETNSDGAGGNESAEGTSRALDETVIPVTEITELSGLNTITESLDIFGSVTPPDDTVGSVTESTPSVTTQVVGYGADDTVPVVPGSVESTGEGIDPEVSPPVTSTEASEDVAGPAVSGSESTIGSDLTDTDVSIEMHGFTNSIQPTEAVSMSSDKDVSQTSEASSTTEWARDPLPAVSFLPGVSRDYPTASEASSTSEWARDPLPAVSFLPGVSRHYPTAFEASSTTEWARDPLPAISFLPGVSRHHTTASEASLTTEWARDPLPAISFLPGVSRHYTTASEASSTTEWARDPLPAVSFLPGVSRHHTTASEASSTTEWARDLLPAVSFLPGVSRHYPTASEASSTTELARDPLPAVSFLPGVFRQYPTPSEAVTESVLQPSDDGYHTTAIINTKRSSTTQSLVVPFRSGDGATRDDPSPAVVRYTTFPTEDAYQPLTFASTTAGIVYGAPTKTDADASLEGGGPTQPAERGDKETGSRVVGESEREDYDTSRIMLILLLWSGSVVVLFLIIVNYEKFLNLWEYRCVCGVSRGYGRGSAGYYHSHITQGIYQHTYDVKM